MEYNNSKNEGLGSFSQLSYQQSFLLSRSPIIISFSQESPSQHSKKRPAIVSENPSIKNSCENYYILN